MRQWLCARKEATLPVVKRPFVLAFLCPRVFPPARFLINDLRAEVIEKDRQGIAKYKERVDKYKTDAKREQILPEYGQSQPLAVAVANAPCIGLGVNIESGERMNFLETPHAAT